MSQHIVLIRPARVVSDGTWGVPVTPPLGLAYLAAVLRRDGHRVTAVDAIAEGLATIATRGGHSYQGLDIADTVVRVPLDATVVGVSCMFSQEWPFVRRLVRALRDARPSVLIVAGGEHISALPEFSLRDCPALGLCVLGEGEEILRELATCLSQSRPWHDIDGIARLDEGRFVRTVPRARVTDLAALPYPAWDLFPMEVYLSNTNTYGVYRGRHMPILATRGCPYQCTFCSNPQMYGTLWKARPPGDVADEIAHDVKTYGAQNIDFYDLTMVLKRQWILDFCAEMVSRRLPVVWQLPSGTRSEVIDDEVAAALMRAGCRNLVLAPESGSPRVLRQIGKRVDLRRLIEAISAARRHGLNVKTNHIVGFPDETRADIMRTVWFAWRQAAIGVDATAFTLFTPYPGTELFDQMRARGDIETIDDAYFNSLGAYLDPWMTSPHCRSVGPRELACWRMFGMMSFFAVSLTLRPWRLARLAWNLLHNRADTILEHRLREWLGLSAPAVALPTRSATVPEAHRPVS